MSEAQPQSQRAPAGGIDEGRSFAIAAARIASANKATDVRVLDLRGLSNLADFFVIGTGTSNRQMHAVFDQIEEHGRSVGRRPFGVGDTREAAWLLVDYVDVVVHLFDEEHRAYYDLDGLWGDAPQIDWQAEPAAPPPQ
ncbi:MAG: ribosome silencing factor [Planctomycetota bacterium]